MRPSGNGVSRIVCFLLFIGFAATAGADPNASEPARLGEILATLSGVGVQAGTPWVFEPSLDSTEFGWSVSTAGDVDGDGYSDVLVGAPLWDAPGAPDAGRVYLFRGAADGLQPFPSWEISADSTADAQFGWSVSTAGDVNGDGYDDVIIGGYNTARANVYLGSPAGLEATPVRSWSGGPGYGRCVSAAGDVDNDGYADVLVGDPLYSGSLSEQGRVHLYRGFPFGPSATASWEKQGDGAGYRFGETLAAAGDVNDDAQDDVLIGAPNVGRAYVYKGGGPGLLTLEASWLGAAGSGLGRSLAGAGDVNADGYADVIIGAPSENTGTGRVNIYYGSSTGPAAVASWTVTGPGAASLFGWCVATAGDLNADGIADLVVSSQENFLDGKVYVYLGASGGPSTTPSWTSMGGGGAQSMYGYSVATAGDVNGDGLSDFVAGEIHQSNGQPWEGRVYGYYGCASALSTLSDLTSLSNQAGGNNGWAVADAGDVNGDGYGDMLIGSPGYDSWGLTQNGRVLLVYGDDDGTYSQYVFDGTTNGELFGYSVSGAGDVNGDGYSDFLVGAPGYSGAVTGGGQARLYYGSPTVPAAGPAWGSSEANLQAQNGRCVSGAGDVNGDGYADVIIGAPFYDGAAGADEGRVTIYFGSQAGLSATPDWAMDGGTAGMRWGWSVTGAGDIDADGYSDVVIGAPNYATQFGQTGRVRLYRGSSSGPGGVASLSSSGPNGSSLGYSVSDAGDVNGDGYADFLVGNPDYDDFYVDRGRVRLYLGDASGVPVLSSWLYTGPNANYRIGINVSGAGDVNGDGLSDILVGSPFSDASTPDGGEVELILGSAGTPATTPEWSLSSSQGGSWYGYATSSAGDLNGDGFSDVVYGAPLWDQTYANEGLVRVFHGNGIKQTAQYAPHYAPRLWTADPGPLAPGNHLAGGALYAVAEGRGPAGRTRMRIEHQVAPLGTPIADGVFERTSNWSDSGPVVSGASSAETCAYITDLDPNTNYQIRFRVGTRSPYFPHSKWLTDESAAQTLKQFRTGDFVSGIGEGTVDGPPRPVLTAFPNPFRSGTRVRFGHRSAGPVRLRVFDVHGRLVATPVDRVYPEGPVSLRWDGDGAGRPVAPGLYFLRLEADGITRTGRVTRIDGGG